MFSERFVDAFVSQVQVFALERDERRAARCMATLVANGLSRIVADEGVLTEDIRQECAWVVARLVCAFDLDFDENHHSGGRSFRE